MAASDIGGWVGTLMRDGATAGLRRGVDDGLTAMLVMSSPGKRATKGGGREGQEPSEDVWWRGGLERKRERGFRNRRETCGG